MRQPTWIMTGAALLSACAAGSAQDAPTVSTQVVPENLPQTEAERTKYADDDTSPVAVINMFNQLAFFDGQPLAAMRRFLSDDFIERSPEFAREGYANDKEAAIAFFETRGWQPGDALTDTIYQVIADGDRVVVFHKVARGADDRGTAYIDIFRVMDGLIVEHWAVGQPVPENITRRHSMF